MKTNMIIVSKKEKILKDDVPDLLGEYSKSSKH